MQKKITDEALKKKYGKNLTQSELESIREYESIPLTGTIKISNQSPYQGNQQNKQKNNNIINKNRIIMVVKDDRNNVYALYSDVSFKQLYHSEANKYLNVLQQHDQRLHCFKNASDFFCSLNDNQRQQINKILKQFNVHLVKQGDYGYRIEEINNQQQNFGNFTQGNNNINNFNQINNMNNNMMINRQSHNNFNAPQNHINCIHGNNQINNNNNLNKVNQNVANQHNNNNNNKVSGNQINNFQNKQIATPNIVNKEMDKVMAYFNDDPDFLYFSKSENRVYAGVLRSDKLAPIGWASKKWINYFKDHNNHSQKVLCLNKNAEQFFSRQFKRIEGFPGYNAIVNSEYYEKRYKEIYNGAMSRQEQLPYSNFNVVTNINSCIITEEPKIFK